MPRPRAVEHMKQQPPAITSLPPSPADERSGRMRNYAIAMTIRMLCLIACVFVQGWWLLIPALGAVLLPAVAVVLANVGSGSSYSDRTPVGPLELASAPSAPTSASASSAPDSPTRAAPASADSTDEAQA